MNREIPSGERCCWLCPRPAGWPVGAMVLLVLGALGNPAHADNAVRVEPRAAGTSANFAPGVSFTVGPDPVALAVADLNGDGRPDVVVVDSYDYTLSILLGDGSGGLSAPTYAYAGPVARDVAVADLNGDGKLDLAVPFTSGAGRIRVKLGSGLGTFPASGDRVYPTGDFPWRLVLRDLNGDGRCDIALIDDIANMLFVYYADATGGFGSPRTSPTVTYPAGIAAGDLNGDGVADLAIVGSGPTITLDLSDGNGGRFASSAAGADSPAQAVAMGDLNGDGRTDLAITNTFRCSVLLGKGDGTFGAPHVFATAFSPCDAALADVDGDGKLDLVGVNNSGNAVTIWPGRGDGTFGASSEVPAGLNPGRIAVADLDRDGHVDLIVTNSTTNSITVLLGQVGLPVPTEVSLVSVIPAQGRVSLVWMVPQGVPSCTVYRTEEGAAWTALALVLPDGLGYVSFEDRTVRPGRRYAYRLGILVGGVERFSAEAWGAAPDPGGLAIRAVAPNPAHHEVLVTVGLEQDGPARLELLDISGRRVVTRDLVGVLTASVTLALDAASSMRSGVYLLRLSQGNSVSTARLCVIR